MPSNLPLVGVEAAILGVGAFQANAKTINGILANVGRSAKLVENIFTSDKSGAAYSANQARIERAAQRVQRVTTDVAAANDRASKQITKQQQVMAAAVQTAAQREVNARSLQAKAAQNLATIQTNQAVTIQRAQDRVANANRRVQIQQELTDKAYTPARAAQLQRSLVAQANAQQQLAATTQRTGAVISRAQAGYVAQQNRVAAATQTTAAVQTAQQAKVAQATANASNVAQQGAQRVSAAQLQLSQAQQRAASTSGVAMAAMGAAAAAAAVAIAYAFANMVSSVVAASNTYQQQMQFMGAIAGLTGGQVAELSNIQMQLSRTTLSSAQDLSVLSTELLKAGFSYEELTGGVLKNTNALVTASKGELQYAQAATVMRATMSSFALSAADSEKAVNIITGAVQNSTLSFTSFLDALKQGSSVIAASNTDLLDFSTAVALATRVIPAGAEVGTALRNTFLRLQAPSKQAAAVMREYGISLYDANGGARGFRDVLVDLTGAFGRNEDGTKKVTDAQREHALAVLGGARVAKVLAAIIDQGIDQYDQLRTTIENSNSAMQIQDALMRSNAGLLETLGNNIQTLGLAFGEGLDPYLNAVIQHMLEYAQSIDPALDNSRALGEAVGGPLANALLNLGEILGKVIIPVIVVLGETVAACAMLWADEFQLMGDAMSSFYDITLAISNGLIGIFQAIVNGVQQMGGFIAQNLQAQAQNFQAWMQSSGSFVNGVIEAFQIFLQGMQTTGNVVADVGGAIQQNFGGVVNGAVQMANGIIQAFNGLANAVARIFQGIAEKVNIFLDSLAAIPEVGEALSGVRARVSGFGAAVAGGVGAAGVAVQKFTSGAAAQLQKFAGAAGGAIGNFNQGVTGTLNNVASSIGGGLGRIGETYGNFFNRVGTALDKFRKTVQFPEFQDYAGRIAKRIEDARTKAIGGGKMGGTPPDEYQEPGTFPGGGGGKDKGGGDKAGKKAAEDYANALGKAQELLRDFFDDVNNLWRDAAKSYSDAFEKAEQTIKEATDETTLEIAKAVLEAEDEVKKLNTTKAIEKDAERRKKVLEDELNYENQVRERAQEDADTIYQRELEDLENIEQQKREARERTFDREQQLNAQRRDDERAYQDRDYDRLLDAQQNALDKQQTAIEDALQKRISAEEEALNATHEALQNALEKDQEARQTALDKQLAAEEEALKASQDRRLAQLKGQLDAEKRAREARIAEEDITREATTGRTEAEQQYQKEIGIGVKESIARQRRQEKLDAINQKEEEDKAKLAITQQTNQAELDFEAEQQRKLDELQAVFDAEDRQRQANEEAAKLALRTQTEAETAAMQAQFRAEDTVLKERHEEELDHLHEAHEQARDALSRRIEDDRLARQMQRAKEDREFSEAQEAAKQKFIEEENKRQLEATRKKEDEDRERKRRQENIAIAQRISDEDRRALLAEQLDDEEFQRRVDQIATERDERIKKAEDALEETHKKTLIALDRELKDLEEQLDEKITTIRTRYNDRLEDLLREGGDAMKPIIDNIGEQMVSAFEGATNQVTELVTTLQNAIALAGQAAQAINNMPKMPAPGSGNQPSAGGGGAGGGKCDWWGIYNACKGSGGKDADCRAKADRECPPERRQTGGPVKAGRAYFVGEQGPEMFVPSSNGKIIPFGASQRSMGCPECGGDHQHLASVRASEGVGMRAGSPASYITNNYQYSVEANYGRTQPAGSIRMDLAALVALTRR